MRAFIESAQISVSIKLTVVATLIFLRTETNPLIVVGAAALVGYLGFVRIFDRFRRCESTMAPRDEAKEERDI